MIAEKHTKPNKYVAYYRVSTNKQSKSGLGLEAQRTIIQRYINNNTSIIAEYTEIESGKNDKRIELNKALAYTKQTGAILIIAKLDRLSRNVGFIFTLRDSGVNFICADFPEFNTITLSIIAGFAQHERELISQRTKAALAEVKKRGGVLGNPNLAEARKNAIQNSKQAKLQNAMDSYKKTGVIATIQAYRSTKTAWSTIATKLNENGIMTNRNKLWQAVQVQRAANMFGIE